MFKKRDVEAACISLLIKDVLKIDHKLAEIERDIDELKHDKSATLFGIVIDLTNSVEKEIKSINNERWHKAIWYEAAKQYIESATSRLEQIKKDIRLILYGAKFG